MLRIESEYPKNCRLDMPQHRIGGRRRCKLVDFRTIAKRRVGAINRGETPGLRVAVRLTDSDLDAGDGCTAIDIASLERRQTCKALEHDDRRRPIPVIEVADCRLLEGWLCTGCHAPLVPIGALQAMSNVSQRRVGPLAVGCRVGLVEVDRSCPGKWCRELIS